MSGFVKDILKALIRKRQPINLGDTSRFEAVDIARDGRMRGRSVDRHYIEAFLHTHKSQIAGDVLEIADDLYTRQFGQNVTGHHILHVEADAPKATIIGDLTQLEQLPEGIADCFICTQTLMFIFDYEAAIKGCKRLLKPGGTLLLTVSGISHLMQREAETWGDFWRFTEQSCQRLFANEFGEHNVDVQAYGNLASTMGFLQRVAVEDFPDRQLLDHHDSAYPLIIGVVARK